MLQLSKKKNYTEVPAEKTKGLQGSGLFFSKMLSDATNFFFFFCLFFFLFPLLFFFLRCFFSYFVKPSKSLQKKNRSLQVWIAVRLTQL